ncbi:DNA-(apurinic or apyrimidinic site) endonuclease 2-like [Ornithodoros turicata]|uniref:DNA-(apurinic or apyrimidinic site) endonuclease 2-like n=1 Tax=Ornithodoros turicata TaxID=34597 RepID=UPI0031387934
MKLLSWNINGLRSFKTSVKDILESLDADVICFQETKINRGALDETSAIVDGYSTYFSFPRHQTGYSGVATFCKDSCRPFQADDSLAGSLDKTSSLDVLGCHGDYSQYERKHLLALDSEGRAVLTLHHVETTEGLQMIAVINVYCPRADPEKPERGNFKLDFYKLLELRARALLRDGYHVVVLGDLNTSHRKIDHCDPACDEEFNANPGRQWLNDFLAPSKERTGEDETTGAGFCDTFRHVNPTRENAFTCWNTRLSARQTNYGTRIDYVLISEGLVGYLESADIMPEVQGSDHCPVTATLRCVPLGCSQCPSLATAFWPEFAGKQQGLMRFLSKQSGKASSNGLVAPSPKRPKHSAIPKGQTAIRPSQKKLKDFFISPKPISSSTDVTPNLKCIDNIDTQHRDSVTCSDANGTFQDCTKSIGQSEASLVWKGLLKGPSAPPCCIGHNEPCVLRVVKKNGPNKGRTFFVCAKPEGRANDPAAKCDFFQWANSVRKASSQS